MNWQRGFLRLWYVFALLWVIGGQCSSTHWVATSRCSLRKRKRELRRHQWKTETAGQNGTAKLDPVQDADIERLLAEFTGNQARWAITLSERSDEAKAKFFVNLFWVFIPPIALLVLGLMVRWIIRGFTTGRAS